MANKFTFEMIKNNYSDYEERMLAAFVGKPESFPVYKKMFTNIKNGNKIQWSWWGFFGNVWFLFYRKVYTAALMIGFVILLFLSIGSLYGGVLRVAEHDSSVGFIFIIIGFLFQTVFGMYSMYLVYQRYINLKSQIESSLQNEDDRIKYMMDKGGYNNWAIAMYVVYQLVLMIGGNALGYYIAMHS